MSEDKSIIIKKTTAVGPTGTVGLSIKPEEKPCPEIHLKWHGREVEVDVVCHEGLPIGYIDMAAHKMIQEVMRIRAKERTEAKMGEYQKGLDKEVKTEGQEMAEAFEAAQEKKKKDLPELNPDTPSTAQ